MVSYPCHVNGGYQPECDRLEVLGALIGRIPPNHLWAELLWQRQQDLTKHASASTAS